MPAITPCLRSHQLLHHYTNALTHFFGTHIHLVRLNPTLHLNDNHRFVLPHHTRICKLLYLMIHIGLVGLGKIGMRHLEAYKQVQGANVSGIYDIDNAHAQQCCRDFNVDWQKGMQHSPRISYYPSYESLLEDEDIDVIDICTPTPTHHLLILDALNHDKHVFCEKPLTHRLVYAQEIERRANKVARLVSVGYLYRFHPSFQLLKQLLNDNILGDPYFAILRIGGRGGWRLWKHQRAFAGGAILEMMVHMLDLAYYWFGEYAAYYVHRATLLPKRRIAGKLVHVDAEDLVLFHLKSTDESCATAHHGFLCTLPP